MEDITLIVGIVVAVIVGIVAFKFIFGAMRLISVFVSLLIAAILVFSGIVVFDAYRMRETISSGDAVLLISEGGEIKEGVIIKGGLLTEEELADYVAAIEEKGKVKDAIVFVVDKLLLSEEEQELDASEISNNPFSLIKHYKSGRIKIYPETFSLKAIKYVPDLFFNKLYGKLSEEITDES